MSGLFELIPNTANIAIWCMIIASVLPIVFAMIAKLLAGFKLEDNAHPREFLKNTTGMAARANAAQQNSFENLPIFLSAMVVAMLFFVPQFAINNIAVMYIVIRILYGIAYLLNLATFRSILWALSMACCFMLFYLPIKLSF